MLGLVHKMQGFNLGIEMLFVSSVLCDVAVLCRLLDVSISESRCFSFQGNSVFLLNKVGVTRVSISESRCFSFQGRPFGSLTVRALIGSDSTRYRFSEAQTHWKYVRTRFKARLIRSPAFL